MVAHASKDMETNGLLPVVVTQGTPKEAEAFWRNYRVEFCVFLILNEAPIGLWLGTRKSIANISFAACLGLQSALEAWKRLENRAPAQRSRCDANGGHVCDRHGWTHPLAILLR